MRLATAYPNCVFICLCKCCHNVLHARRKWFVRRPMRHALCSTTCYVVHLVCKTTEQKVACATENCWSLGDVGRKLLSWREWNLKPASRRSTLWEARPLLSLHLHMWVGCCGCYGGNELTILVLRVTKIYEDFIWYFQQWKESLRSWRGCRERSNESRTNQNCQWNLENLILCAVCRSYRGSCAAYI